MELTVVVFGWQQPVLGRHRLAEVGAVVVVAVAGVGAVDGRRVTGHRLLLSPARHDTSLRGTTAGTGGVLLHRDGMRICVPRRCCGTVYPEA